MNSRERRKDRRRSASSSVALTVAKSLHSSFGHVAAHASALYVRAVGGTAASVSRAADHTLYVTAVALGLVCDICEHPDPNIWPADIAENKTLRVCSLRCLLAANIATQAEHESANYKRALKAIDEVAEAPSQEEEVVNNAG